MTRAVLLLLALATGVRADAVADLKEALRLVEALDLEGAEKKLSAAIEDLGQQEQLQWRTACSPTSSCRPRA